MLHAPGPRGSPHVPHGAIGAFELFGPPAPTAKTDSSRSSSSLRHDGQAGVRPSRASASK